MSSAPSLLQQLNDASLSHDARIHICCELAAEMEEAGGHEGALDEARALLQNMLGRRAGVEAAQQSFTLLALAAVERAANRLNDALGILIDASPLLESTDSHAIKGIFHYQLGTVLKDIGAAEERSDYIDRALIEYAAASFHFDRAGNVRYRARVENNLGCLFLAGGKFAEAHEHLERARRLFGSLKDKAGMAQLDETRARLFLSEGRNAEAEKVLRTAARYLEECGERTLLAKALVTRGTALARLGRYEDSRAAFEKAIEAAYRAGDREGAGLAALKLLEEAGEHLGREERLAIYERADSLLAHAERGEVLARLREAARKALAVEPSSSHQAYKRRWPNFVYASSEMAERLKRAHLIATTGEPLLITGEAGTGKELLARLVHEWSGRAGELVIVDCEALEGELVESELFGHKVGSFKDAVSNHTGLVREAAGGTLLLDEVAELSPAMQSKLLRVIEHGEIQTIGATVPGRVDVRIVASTRHDLQQMVAKGDFREDLFYRLQAFHVEIPPLRERPEDIEALAKHFIREALAQVSKRVVFTREALKAVCKLPLEGNGRELQALIERTVLVAEDGAVITAEAVEAAGMRCRREPPSFADPWEGFSLNEEVRRFEARFIELALKEAGGKVSHAARLLGFKHHESLTSLLETKHSELLESRLPSTPRRRSIIRRK